MSPTDGQSQTRYGGQHYKRPPSNARSAGGSNKKRRYRLVAITLVGLMAVLVAALARVQIFSAATYAADAKGELDQTISLPSVRGSIYDRDGDLLSVSVPRYDVVADDFLISSPGSVAQQLSGILNIPTGKLVSELSEQNGYVVIARQISSSTNSAVENLGLSGITTQIDTLRVSPGSSVFQPVLGAVNAAGDGDAGLEYAYNSQLAGQVGKEIIPEAPGGVQLPGQPQILTVPKSGQNIVLTLDEPLQVEVTKDVTSQMIATHSLSGIAVVEDVHSGAILAMVDLCHVSNGVCAGKGPIAPAPTNLAVTAVYQPGSVMKLATISFAMKYGLISPSTTFVIPYSLNIGGYTFQDADVHPTLQEPVSWILAQSSNIGTIEIERDLGSARLSQALTSFGYGRYTGLNWPGESPGLVSSPSSWETSTAATVAIGTGVSVTPMQVLDAYSSVANGGVLLPPRVVQGVVSGSGQETVLPAVKGHVTVPASVASAMIPMLEGVVQDGTAVSACIPGYTVAGKTGTAQVPSTSGLGYIPGDWNATFVGFVPAQSPKLSAIVVLNHPTPIYGGTVAAPVFASIMGYALRHFDIPPPVHSNGSAVQCAGTSK